MLLTLLNIKIQSQSLPWQYIGDVTAVVGTVPYIFEGQVESVEVFAGDDAGNRLPLSSVVWSGNIGTYYDSNGDQAKGYSLAKIRVCRVFKGSIEGGTTIKVLTKSFSLDNVCLHIIGTDTVVNFVHNPISHDDQMEYRPILPHISYEKRIYLADRIDNISSTNYSGQFYRSNFHTKLEIPLNVPAWVTQPTGQRVHLNGYCLLYDYIFDNKNDFDFFLSQIPGINPTPTNYCERDLRGKQNQANEDAGIEVKIDYVENKKNYKEWLDIAVVKMEKAKAEQQTHTSNKTTLVNDLTLNIANDRVIKIGANKWLEFDVLVSANNTGLYFDNAILRLLYSNSAFGNSVVVNSNIVVTRASAYNIPTYVDPMTIINDYAGNSVSIPFGINTSYSPISRIQIPTIPQIMYTVRMKIQNCGVAAGISPTDQSSLSFFCWYTPAANTSTNTNLLFNNVNYYGGINDNTCDPVITAFTNNVPAGVHQKVTIQGKYFGSYKGSGGVIFRNSDKGNRYPVFAGTNNGGVQAYDILSWTHDKIEIILPGVIDSAYVWQVSSTGTQSIAVDVVPGSGKFKVVNYIGGVKESSTPITIPYAVAQVYEGGIILNTPYRKTNIHLASLNNNGYKVQLNTRMYNSTYYPNLTNVKPVVKKAMKDWSCATGINWFVGADTTKGRAMDYVCVIDTGRVLGTTAAAATVRNLQFCQVNGVNVYYLRSFDIIVNPFMNTMAGGDFTDDTANAMPSGKYDAYSIFSHEFGHAHLLSHANDSINDVMWYRSSPGPYAFINRKLIRYSPDAVSGGNWVTDSLVSTMSCVGTHVLVSPQGCDASTPVGMMSNSATNDNISVYPNPTSGDETIKIKFGSPNEQISHFVLTDITGKEILKSPLLNNKNAYYDLVLGNIAPGVYLLQIHTDSRNQTFKIIKQ